MQTANQNALIKAALFYCLPFGGLRETELASFNKSQYHSRGFHEVKRKGNKVTKKVPLPAEAKEWLDKDLKGRGENLLATAPLFVTRYGNRIHRTDIFSITQRICNQANTGGGVSG